VTRKTHELSCFLDHVGEASYASNKDTRNVLLTHDEAVARVVPCEDDVSRQTQIAECDSDLKRLMVPILEVVRKRAKLSHSIADLEKPAKSGAFFVITDPRATHSDQMFVVGNQLSPVAGIIMSLVEAITDNESHSPSGDCKKKYEIRDGIREKTRSHGEDHSNTFVGEYVDDDESCCQSQYSFSCDDDSRNADYEEVDI
jgi:hypothetical protein